MSTETESKLVDTSESHAYTYEVTMVIQIVAPSKEVADAKLDQEGGYISKRDVKFLRSLLLYKDEKNPKDK